MSRFSAKQRSVTLQPQMSAFFCRVAHGSSVLPFVCVNPFIFVVSSGSSFSTAYTFINPQWIVYHCDGLDIAMLY